MTHDKSHTKDIIQPQSAYSTLSGKAAVDYLSEIGSPIKKAATVHIIFGQPTKEVPQKLRAYVPVDAVTRLKEIQVAENWQAPHPNWDSPEFAGQISSENLAGMFTLATTTIIQDGNNYGRPNNEMMAQSILSGEAYVDMFAIGVKALNKAGVINNDQMAEMFRQKIDALTANPTSIFNFNFSESLPIAELAKLGEPKQIARIVELMTKWDQAQAGAVKIIAASENTKVRIAGLLPGGTPGKIVDVAVATAEQKADDVNKLIEWSKDIPVEHVFEAVDRFGKLSQENQEKVDSLVQKKRSWQSLAGEKQLFGNISDEAKGNFQSLLHVIGLDSFDLLDATAPEREVLEQRLSAWSTITSPDHRNHVNEFKKLLEVENGKAALDRLNQISTYLLSISRQSGK